MKPATDRHGAGAGDDLWLPPLTAARRRRDPTTGRGSRPPLSRDQIVQAAVAVADREGADAVGMRRIARELGAGNMSIYWHVASKDELLALMIDAVEGEFEIAEPSGYWRADLTQSAHDIRAVLIRHAWMANFIGFRRSVGPNELVHLENSLATLCGSELRLPLPDALRVLMAVETYVLGFALRDRQELPVERNETPRLTPDPELDADAQAREYVRRLHETGRYPYLTRLFVEGINLERDERFEYGLECLLDGIERDLRTRAPSE